MTVRKVLQIFSKVSRFFVSEIQMWNCSHQNHKSNILRTNLSLCYTYYLVYKTPHGMVFKAVEVWCLQSHLGSNRTMKYVIFINLLLLVNESVCLGQHDNIMQENRPEIRNLQYLRSNLHTIDPRLIRWRRQQQRTRIQVYVA